MAQVVRTTLRRPTNLSLDAALVEQARSLDINISRVAEDGLAKAVSEERARLWKLENAEAIRSLNEYVETYGLGLEEFRQV